jgi:predicted transglutaminase-like cysteine proteinase
VASHLVNGPGSAGLPRRLLTVLIAVLGFIALGIARPDPGGLKDVALTRYGPDAAERVLRWQALVDEARTLQEDQQLRLVNEFFNLNIAFVDDVDAWGVADYWATPLETLGRGIGDCEDYSIAKYVTLGLLGVPLERLRITYVRAETGAAGAASAQAHMVLAYYPQPDAEPLILDNLVARVLPASARLDLQPVFGFNSEGLWIAGVRAPAEPTARLSRWRDLLRRMAREGLG